MKKKKFDTFLEVLYKLEKKLCDRVRDCDDCPLCYDRNCFVDAIEFEAQKFFGKVETVKVPREILQSAMKEVDYERVLSDSDYRIMELKEVLKWDE